MSLDGDEGVDITFANLKYLVKDQKSGEELSILKGVSGACRNSRVLAIMGSSGAGKTTLLDILACNTFGSGRTEGKILVNGAARRAADFQRRSCYVQQRDVLLASSTVRESIMFSALLKLPRTLAYAEKKAQVDRILSELDLLGCQDTLIGDELIGIKGISGGQKRRVSVGIELVKDPQVILLDEPTSGLDSEMAVSLMDMLVSLARRDRTVVLTIHQPNSAITALFDDFLLLAAGQAVYFGPWREAVEFFASSGFVCPHYTNPSDYFLSVLRDPGAAIALVVANLTLASRLRQCACVLAAGPAPSRAVPPCGPAAGAEGGGGSAAASNAATDASSSPRLARRRRQARLWMRRRGCSPRRARGRPRRPPPPAWTPASR